jgi:hypothetical protein
MGLVPNQGHGAWVVFAADEIQPQKFHDMKTHVSTWSIAHAFVENRVKATNPGKE